MFKRLEEVGGDPWKDFFEHRAPLPEFDTIQNVLGS
jgi:hypothetical protein